MEEIIEVAEFYSYPGNEAIFHLSVTNRGSGNKEAAIEYLKKYYIPKKEYTDIWKPIQDSIYHGDRNNLFNIFNPEFDVLFIDGGVLFIEEEFIKLQKCIKEIGDNTLIIIQNDIEGTIANPLRMKYPVDIKWNELMDGNYISTVLFEIPRNEYFVFSESAKWGKYASDDLLDYVDVLGFSHQFANIFHEQYKQSTEEKKEIQEILEQVKRRK